MSKHLIIYSSVDGHTKLICEYILKLTQSVNEVDIISLSQAQNKNLSNYDKYISNHHCFEPNNLCIDKIIRIIKERFFNV